MSKWPPALTSMYVLPPANQDIDLYQGQVLVRNSSFSAEGNGRVYLQWNPRKQLVFEVAAPFTHAEMYGEGVEVITEEFKSGVPGKLLHLEHSYKDGVTGTKFFGLLGAVGIAYGAGSHESEKTIFHLVNLENDGGADFISTAGGGFLAGRHTLETDEWIITLDSLDTLLWGGASTKLPLRHGLLKQIAKQKNWNNNGAEIFLTVRNSLTHSSPKNRQTRSDLPSEALYETYLLGMGYLRGFIQKVLDYPNAFLFANVTLAKE